MELECYPTAERPPEIVPGRPQRAWMDHFAERHPYRCLPLAMANTTGWEILCPMAFTAEWNGGVMQDDITLTADRPHPDFHNFVKSHFSHGVVTFHPGYLFRTPPGWSMVAQGPPAVLLDAGACGLPCDSVCVDNASGAREAVRHLLAQGHGDALAIIAGASGDRAATATTNCCATASRTSSRAREAADRRICSPPSAATASGRGGRARRRPISTKRRSMG